jgi:hypothetical protein
MHDISYVELMMEVGDGAISFGRQKRWGKTTNIPTIKISPQVLFIWG